MTRILTAISLGGILMLSALALEAQSPAPQTPARPQAPAPSADPYAANAAPGAAEFPLAAPAGTDSRARETAPAGATNTGRFDAATWKFGTAFDPPAGTKVWNPVKLKMLAGGKVTGGTLFGATDPSVYCAMANAGYDFIWTEMQHDQRDWQGAARMWRTCPHAKAVPGARVAFGAMGPMPLQSTAVERVLEGQSLDTATIARAAQIALEGLDPPTDALASAWYRREVAGVHLKRLLERMARG